MLIGFAIELERIGESSNNYFLIQDNVLTVVTEVEKEIVVLNRRVQHGKIMTYEGLCLHLILRTSYIIQQRLSMPFRSQIRVLPSSKIKISLDNFINALRLLYQLVKLGFSKIKGMKTIPVFIFIFDYRDQLRSLCLKMLDSFNLHFEQTYTKVEACKGLSTEEVMRVARARYIELSSQKRDDWNHRDEPLQVFYKLAKNEISHHGDVAYISCTPHLLHRRLCSSDCFLVLSFDGLYQYFSNEEVVSHVAWFIENVLEGDPA
ncbi:hypothetical protein GIB67_034390 [Kingdonia uniflora]|uniref:PPM-type phosphatase domain-containing protein n=1 Tax=Kingdonia uniflora TaxID=39325 RepID=A0A7J7NSU7_9MAGN|nr:hypothetical protein GIB67_034390 [Kingdonia uniflora]